MSRPSREDRRARRVRHSRLRRRFFPLIQALEGRQLLSAADFLGTDTTTGGNWRSAYGSDGYDIAQDPSSNNPSLPSYAQVSIPARPDWTWPSGTTGLVPLENAAGTGTILAAWTAADSMDFHIDLTDGQTHQVALYSTDPGSTQQFDIIDTSTGQLLDSETLPGTTGEYIVWTSRRRHDPGDQPRSPTSTPTSTHFSSAGRPRPADAGFESPSVGTGARRFQYDPTGTPWTYSGDAGVAGNGSGFTSGNPNAPEGTQVGFLQETGSISQVVAGMAAGTYTLSFDAAAAGQLPGRRSRTSRCWSTAASSAPLPPRAPATPATRPRLHRRRRDAHDRLPGAGLRRRRQHRLHR